MVTRYAVMARDLHKDSELLLHAHDRVHVVLATDAALLEQRCEQAEARVKALVTALEAQIHMRDMKKPTKLIDALSWRENDEYAAKLADEALKLAADPQAPTQATPADGEKGGKP